jgi:hypothetical protein
MFSLVRSNACKENIIIIRFIEDNNNTSQFVSTLHYGTRTSISFEKSITDRSREASPAENVIRAFLIRTKIRILLLLLLFFYYHLRISFVEFLFRKQHSRQDHRFVQHLFGVCQGQRPVRCRCRRYCCCC